MPIYSVEQLVLLSNSSLVETPEFKWRAFEPVQPEVPLPPRPKRGVPPAVKLAPTKPKIPTPPSDNEDEDTDDPDAELAAHYFLQREEKLARRPSTSGGTVPLKYAASLAAAKDSGDRNPERPETVDSSAIADGEDDGWIPVSREPRVRKKSTGRRASSFSKWR